MNPCAKRIQKELADVLKSDQTAINGFLVKLDGDNLNRWFVAFGRFPPESKLAGDLAKLKASYNQDHILVEVSFPPSYPEDPPFVRILYPRIAFHSGHVTVGGSICIQLLVKTGTSEGWHPSVTMEGLLLTIRQLMIDGGGRIDFNRAMQAYTPEEAKSAFERVAAQHGWFKSKSVVTPATNMPYDFAVVFPDHWKKGQTRAVEHIELPGFDPKDGGEGTMMYNEAAEVVKKFLAAWHEPKQPVVTRVVRLQNQLLFGSYHQRKVTMSYINKGNVNEQWLYHGTKKGNIDQILQHGFDARYAKSGYLGCGIYCTDSSSLADKFTDESRAVFFGRFMLGEVSENSLNVSDTGFTWGANSGSFGASTSGNNKRMAPTRTVYHEGEGRHLTTPYDSVGSFYPGHNCPFWAVYSNDQTYPDYLICYKK